MNQAEQRISTFPALEQDGAEIDLESAFAPAKKHLNAILCQSFPQIEFESAIVRGSTLRHANEKLGIRNPFQDIDYEGASVTNSEIQALGFLGQPKSYLFANHILTAQEAPPEFAGRPIETHLYLYKPRQFETLLERGHIFPASRLIDVCQLIVGHPDHFHHHFIKAFEIYFQLGQSLNPLETPFTVGAALELILNAQMAVEPQRMFGIANMYKDEETWPRNLQLLRSRTNAMLDHLVGQGKLSKQEIDGDLTYQATNRLAVLAVNIWRLRRDFLISDLYFLLPSLTDARGNHLQKVWQKILWACIYTLQNKNNCRFVFNSINS